MRELSPVSFCLLLSAYDVTLCTALSNSFAFGGSNASVLLGVA